ncbi:Lysine exporter protein (LYSE/YGGA) [Thermodesulfatator indicus DSM 15286]|uniref:Lysine exporter protein (LYSE/YGGA) n=1 Tax=Thermodesulfatator indicus (strain DSM 15286 / JCM 11887 / CIR29812) TaxID=667014 RepID=F8A8Q2_THEID|nr:LysE family transporter [Thermodesulfatator indicus]AEH44832.1 Lysine exporter protein (LYSE/YGGA) [Thermodesulfatator indicus DSM 15286]
MEYLILIGTVALVHLLAVVSPGPDFFMVCRNTLTYSKKTGIWTAAGIGLGIAVHVFYSLAGLALIISKSIMLFNIIKFLGAAYLIYIGFKSLFARSSPFNLDLFEQKKDISAFKAARIGFLTNILNPKATLFFLSLFTIVIPPETPLPILLIIGFILMLDTFLWFAFVAICLSQRQVRSILGRFQGIIDKTLGGILIALGIKVALTHR